MKRLCSTPLCPHMGVLEILDKPFCAGCFHKMGLSLVTTPTALNARIDNYIERLALVNRIVNMRDVLDMSWNQIGLQVKLIPMIVWRIYSESGKGKYTGTTAPVTHIPMYL